ncbi:hypothetical protein BJY00DRAFT_268903 [Aspergillus carlsbadensis]|nr:hypothetical protein BJY00DRAFT_268903 [Aspergillus carlsbadensis]
MTLLSLAASLAERQMSFSDIPRIPTLLSPGEGLWRYQILQIGESIVIDQYSGCAPSTEARSYHIMSYTNVNSCTHEKLCCIASITVV